MILTVFSPNTVGNTQPARIVPPVIDTITTQIDSIEIVKERLVNKFDSSSAVATMRALKLERANDDIENRAQVLKRKVDQKLKTKNDKIVYKEKIIYTPVNKSEYYQQSKAWSDSIARQKHIQDSIEAYRKYELKHRSIFKKIFGSKVK
jgi:hypothetical protein